MALSIVLILIIIWHIYRVKKAKKIMLEWTEKNNLTILDKRLEWFLCIFLHKYGNRIVYELIVEKPDGIRKACRIYIGKRFLGLIKPEINVLWDIIVK